MARTRTHRRPRKHKGGKRPWIVRSRSWLSIVIVAPFAVLAALSYPMVRENSVADFLLDTVGWTCFACGAMFRWWATLYVGGRKCHELAVDGPYSICRNPLYFGTFLLTLSIAFYLHSCTFAIGVLMAMPIYLQVTIPWEEGQLRDTFGERFDNYRHRTPQFLPDFSKLHSPSILQVNLNGLMGEFWIALRWMWIPLLAQSLAQLRTATWWPARFYLP